MGVETNQPAPDFTLPVDDGGTFRLSEQRGQSLLLVFYPMDGSPVCTAQLCDYRDGIEAFADLSITVVGISPDDADSHQRFKAKHGLPFALLSDPDYQAAFLYDCKGLLGMKRGVFLVDAGGIVRYAHIEAVAMFRQRREEILAAIRELPQVEHRG